MCLGASMHKEDLAVFVVKVDHEGYGLMACLASPYSKPSKS